MLPLVVVGCTSAVCQSVREATTFPAWIMQPPPDWQTPLNGIISPSERGWSLCKNNWKEPRSILMSRQIELPISMGNSCNYCEQYTRASSEYKCSAIKPSNPFTNVCWVSVLTTFSAPPQILAASTVFFCPIPETKKWWVMVLCYCCWFVLNSKRLLSTSCNKQGQRSSE